MCFCVRIPTTEGLLLPFIKLHSTHRAHHVIGKQVGGVVSADAQRGTRLLLLLLYWTSERIIIL